MEGSGFTDNFCVSPGLKPSLAIPAQETKKRRTFIAHSGNRFSMNNTMLIQ